MGQDHWSRRRFVGSAAGAAGLAALAAGSAPLLAAQPEADLIVFDTRFPAAKLAASRLGRGRMCGIQGDPTELLLRWIAQGPFALQRVRGVTTEAIPFCLASLFPGARLSQCRVDRDLFTWKLEGKA